MRSKTYNKNSKSKNSKKGSYKKDFEKKDQILKVDDRDNDPNWYFTSPELANQAAQLSFQSLLGYGDVYGYKVPSILRVDTTMNPGVTYKPSVIGHDDFGVWSGNTLESVFAPAPGKAGVNLMAAKLYTTLSSFTGRTASYAPQDVAMMILQISAIAELSEVIRRAFGLSLTYNFRNRSMPLGIIRSMGIDPVDLASNLSVYRMRFNVAMSRINQIPLLENIAFIKKSRDVYQRIYMDDPTNMSQIFYYMPSYYFVLDEAGDSDGSVLRANQLISANGTAVSLSTWLTALETMITTALESSTLNFIYADLLNMANKLHVATWQFDYLAENYVVMPEYNANALLQLHNLTIMGRPMPIADSTQVNLRVKAAITSISTSTRKVYVTSGANVYCDANTNDIVYNPSFSCTRNQFTRWIVDMPTDQPTVEDRIEALRYTSVNFGNFIVPSSISGATIAENAYVFNVLPDHYVNEIVLFNNIDISDLNAQGEQVVNSVIATAATLGTGGTKWTAALSQFEHAPIIALGDPLYGTKLGNIFGALQYYTMVDGWYIQRLLDIMTVGLFDFRVK